MFGASVDVLEAVEVVLGQVTALRAAAVHAVAEDTPAGVVGDQVVDVLMMALGRSRRSGLFLREQALLLTHQPQVWAALWAGRLDVTKAGILARALYLVPRLDAHDQERPEYAADCDRILAAGLAYATEHTAGQLDRHLKRLLAAIDPGAVVTRRRRALAERGVWIDHRGDGTADLTARLDSTARRTGLRRDPGPGPGRPTQPTPRTAARPATAAAGSARSCRSPGPQAAGAQGLRDTRRDRSPPRPGDARSTCGWPMPWST